MIAIIIALLLFALAVYLFILFIVKRDRGNREPIEALFIAMGFGLAAVIAAFFLNHFLLPGDIDAIADPTSNQQFSSLYILMISLGVGLIEETVKIVPLALFIYKKRYFNELTDGIIYFGIAALTFGIVEDISYMLNFGGGVGIFRILLSPYLHATFTILFGLALAYKKVLNKSWWLVFAGYLSAIVVHGLYDFFIFSRSPAGTILSLVIALFSSVVLFVLFRKAQIDDEKSGQSTKGINKFCRHCGKPNPKRLLYCSFCGKLS